MHSAVFVAVANTVLLIQLLALYHSMYTSLEGEVLANECHKSQLQYMFIK